MRKLPSLKQLQYLVALHENQHFGRAADACFISQSTLSTAIMHLEEILQAQLLERDHKTFLFTPLGNAIVHQSKDVIEKSAALVDYAKTQGAPMEGDFHLGCIPTIAPFLVSELLEATNLAYPKLSVFLKEDTTDTILRQLSEGKLDMAILSLPYPSQGLATRILTRDPFHLVLHQQWSDKTLNKEMTLWPDKSILLLEKEHCLTQDTLIACQVKENKKIHPFSATSLHTLVQMVNSGLGITFLPQLAINSGLLLNTSLLSHFQERAYREIGIAWRPTSDKQESYALFGSIIQEVLIKKIRSNVVG